MKPIRPVIQSITVLALVLAGAVVASAAPTDGYTQYSASFSVQHPYNLPLSSRYTVVNGVHTFWVYGDDQPFEQGSTTGPRTEARVDTWKNQTRQNMFEADCMLQSNTKTCIMQIKSNTSGEAVYIQVVDPALHYPSGTIGEKGPNPVLATVGQNTWFHMNCMYNPATGARGVWINGSKKLSTGSTSSARDWYFKFGVYDNNSGSTHILNKVSYKNMKYWLK